MMNLDFFFLIIIIIISSYESVCVFMKEIINFTKSQDGLDWYTIMGSIMLVYLGSCESVSSSSSWNK